MPKRNQITEEQALEIEQIRKKNKDKNKEKRLKALVLHSKGESRADIAKATGFAATYITELVSKFCKVGISSIVDNHYCGNHRCLTFEEEKALLEPFMAAAAAGKMIDVSEIKAVYEAKIGRTLENNRGQIYRVLERHGWRKVMPRSEHPNKASDEDIEASKKLTLLSRGYWKNLPINP